MIEIDCPQGSDEWIGARLGIPTASEFSRIVTPSGKLSSQRDGYLAELLAEWALEMPVREFGGTEWTERGKALEPDAFRYYAFHRDVDPQRVGFCYQDESKMVGCSPDALVGDDGTLELKCPMAATHLLWLIRGECPREHWPQCQGQLWVTGRSWCYFMSFYPDLPPFVVRVYPDNAWQTALNEHMPRFIHEILEGRERLRELGVVPVPEAA